MRRTTLGLSLAVALISPSALGQAPRSLGDGVKITEHRLKSHLELIAHDLLEGRDTPSRGQDFAALYVATQLKLWGVQPGGDNGTYFQTIELSRPTLIPDRSSLTVGGKTRIFGDGFIARGPGGDLSGQLVFVGHGHTVESKGVDPYKGLDLQGKIAVVAGGRPPEFEFTLMREGKAQLPAQAAAARGAKALITVEPGISAEEWSQRVTRASQPGQPSMGGGGRGFTPIPSLVANEALATELFAGEKMDGAQILAEVAASRPIAPFAMTKSISGTLVVEGNTQTTQNVIGIVPGTDPKLRSEYVAYGAHIDHVGMAQSGEDRIFNGADDDGSGTVAILEIAHALATGQRPKRSSIFIWHTGEEKGLWGAEYFVEHPTVPLDKIIAQLNIDMIGRSRPEGDTNTRNNVLSGPDTIYVVGSNRLSRDLGSMVATVNGGVYGINLDYKYDAPNDPENIYQRSDHYHYARKGIPIAFWFDGVHEDYHRVSDHVDKIDFRKLMRVTHTVYALGVRLGNEPQRPRLNGTDVGTQG